MHYRNLLLILLSFLLPQWGSAQADSTAFSDEVRRFEAQTEQANDCYRYFVQTGIAAFRRARDTTMRLPALEEAERQFRAAQVCLDNRRMESLQAGRFLEIVLRYSDLARLDSLQQKLAAMEARDSRAVTLLAYLAEVDSLSQGMESDKDRLDFDNGRRDLLALVQREMELLQEADGEEEVHAAERQMVEKAIESNMAILRKQPEPALELAFEARNLQAASGSSLPNIEQTFGNAVIANTGHLLTGHRKPVLAVAFSSDGDYLLTRSRDSTVGIWKSDMVGGLPVILPHAGFVFDAVWATDGSGIYTACSTGEVTRWNLSGEPELSLPTHPKEVLAVTADDQGRIVTACRDGYARLFAADGALIDSMEHGWPVYAVEFSKDGKQLLTQSPQGVKVWSDQGDLHWQIQPGNSLLYAAHFLPDAGRIVTSSTNGSIELWNFEMPGDDETKRERTLHQGSRLPILRVVDGRFLLAAAPDGSLKVWDQENADGPVFTKTDGDALTAVDLAPFSVNNEAFTLLSAVGPHRLLFRLDDAALPGVQFDTGLGSIQAVALSRQKGLFAAGLDNGQVLLGKVPEIKYRELEAAAGESER